jgi:hypothetical protein
VKSPALVGVEREPEAFAELFAAARLAGSRIGWLDLVAAPASPLPATLEAAATLGARRAVAAGGGRSVAVKPLAGDPVLRDLLREHFLGCTLVLARGVPGFPRIDPEGAGFRLHASRERSRHLEAEALLAELARPLWRDSRKPEP